MRVLEEIYGRFDRVLDGREYHSGAFSVADIGTFIMTYAAGTLGAPIPATLLRMRAWSERVGARPAVRRVVEDMSEAAARGLVA